jgi:hypothetical protein
MNKKVLIGLGILAVAGIGFYFYNKNKSTQNNEIDWKKTDAEIAKEFGLDLEQVVEMRKNIEGKSNAFGRSFGSGKMAKVDCPVGCSCNNGQINCFTESKSGSKNIRYDGIKPVNTPAQFSGAIGRRSFGANRGNLGGGIVNIADPSKLCCCAGTADAKGWCNNPSTRCCPDIAGQPAPLPTNLGFSGAIGRVGLSGVGLSTGNIQNQLNCSPDCGTIDCTRRGQASKCCKPCATTPTSTTTTTVSSFNGYVNPMYNNLTLLVDPANV